MVILVRNSSAERVECEKFGRPARARSAEVPRTGRSGTTQPLWAKFNQNLRHALAGRPPSHPARMTAPDPPEDHTAPPVEQQPRVATTVESARRHTLREGPMCCCWEPNGVHGGQ